MKLKSSLSILALTLIANAAMAADAKPVFQKTFPNTDDEKIETYVIETYKAALSAPKTNKVQQVVAQLNKDYEEEDAVGEVLPGDLFQIGSGHGGAGSYGVEYLLSLPIKAQGHGMIETKGAYFRVYTTLNMEKETTTVTIENLVELVDKK